VKLPDPDTVQNTDLCLSSSDEADRCRATLPFGTFPSLLFGMG